MGCATGKSHLFIVFIYIQCSDFPGVFAAAHDLKTEWVVVKGIKDYADASQSSSDEWGTFASVMAASVVANILSDAIIFEDWPHYDPGNVFSPIPALFSLHLLYTLSLKKVPIYHEASLYRPLLGGQTTWQLVLPQFW